MCFWHGLETLLPDYKDKDLIAVLCLGGLYLLYNFQFIMRLIFVVRKYIEQDKAFHTHQCLLLHKGNIYHLYIYIYIYHRTVNEVCDHFQYLDNDLLSLERKKNLI